MLTAAEVFVGASLLARVCAVVGYLIAGVTEPVATLHAPDNRAVRPVRDG